MRDMGSHGVNSTNVLGADQGSEQEHVPTNSVQTSEGAAQEFEREHVSSDLQIALGADQGSEREHVPTNSLQTSEGAASTLHSPTDPVGIHRIPAGLPQDSHRTLIGLSQDSHRT